MAITGQSSWPSAGHSLATYGQLFMAAYNRPLRPPTTSCARARSDVPAPGRNPPPANSERREETAASRFNGSPPQAETHGTPAAVEGHRPSCP
ncbi:hypothetical protein MICRO116_330001 [Micrococcus sp. 116]|nr:hypothetical protein MICRO116_330001 [Micrococcus sp. 116]